MRYARPSIWPWAAVAAIVGALLVAALRRRPELRGQLTTLLGALAGLAGLATLSVFGAADAPNGRVAWAQFVIAVRSPRSSWRAHPSARHSASPARRVHRPGVAVVSLSYLSVFWHGVVIFAAAGDGESRPPGGWSDTGAAAAVSSLGFEGPA